MANPSPIDPSKAANAVLAATIFAMVRQLSGAKVLDVDKLVGDVELFVGDLGKLESVQQALGSVTGVLRSLKPLDRGSDG